MYRYLWYRAQRAQILNAHSSDAPTFSRHITVEPERKITQNFLGEHKVVTPKQQFLGLILCFFIFI